MSIDQAVDHLNEFLVEGTRLRRYQQQILTTGTFHLDGQEPSAAAVLAGHDIAYQFSLDGREAWLVAHDIGDGFPLSVLCRDGEHRQVGAPRPRYRPEWAARAAESVAGLETSEPIDPPDARPLLVTGHPNFAHHAWNELPALLDADLSRVSLAQWYRPLGDVRALLGVDLPTRVPPAVGTVVAGAGLVRVGSVRVSRAAQCVVRRAGEARLTGFPAADELLEATGPRVWLSLRRDKRSCANVIEFLAAVVVEFDRRFPGCVFVVDGFSDPEDVGQNPHYPAFAARREDAFAAVAELRAAVPEDVRGRVLDTLGLSILQSIALAGCADYYVCHEGSVQHKVGWFHPATPGFLHHPPAGTHRAVRAWHARMSEGATEPAGVVPADVSPGQVPPGQPARNASYVIDDPGALARRIGDDFAVRSPVRGFAGR